MDWSDPPRRGIPPESTYRRRHQGQPRCPLQMEAENGQQFDDFIGKPFRFERLCECLANVLSVEYEYAETVSMEVIILWKNLLKFPDFVSRKMGAPQPIIEGDKKCKKSH